MHTDWDGARTVTDAMVRDSVFVVPTRALVSGAGDGLSFVLVSVPCGDDHVVREVRRGPVSEILISSVGDPRARDVWYVVPSGVRQAIFWRSQDGGAPIYVDAVSR
jgi:hypothetical protein